MSQQDSARTEDQNSSLIFTPIEETFFNNLVNSFKSRVLRQQAQPVPTITLQQAQAYFNTMSKSNDIGRISDLGFQDFVDYLKSIKSEYFEFRKLQKAEKHQEEPQNIDQMVVDCYQEVPQVYFEQNFRFNYGLFGQSRENINKYLEQAQQHLDDVEFTLFFQINSRFDSFLSVILNLNKMNGLVESNIEKVQSLRTLYSQTRKEIIQRSLSIAQKKQAYERVEQQLYMLKLVQSTNKSLQSLTELINNQKYEQAIKLIAATEASYQQLNQIQSLNTFPNRLKALQNHLQSSITAHLLSMLISSLTQQLTPVRSLMHQLGQQLNEHDDSVLANSFVNDSWYDQSQSGPIRPYDEHFTKVLISASKIIDLSDKVFKQKIMEELQGYYQEFIIQLKDFLSKENDEQILVFDETVVFEQLNQVMEDIPQYVFHKIVHFFTENLQKLINAEIYACQTIAKTLQDNPKIIEIIDEQYSIPVVMLKFANDKIASLITSKRISAECSVKEFIDLLQIYKDWEQFFNNDIGKLCEFGQEKIQGRIKLQHQKCSINQMIYMRASQEKSYLQCFHKEKSQLLVKYLENETWNASDISFDNYEILSYLMDLDQDYTLELDESVILNTSIAGGKNLLQQLVNNNVFKIIKTEIITLKDNKKYKVTQAFLFFIQLIFHYIKLYENFSTLTNEQTTKLIELIKLYNSLSTQLILGAGAIHFGKITTITAKNLAISSVCLKFFIYLIDTISSKLFKIVNQFPQNDYTNALQLSQDLNKIKSDYINHNQEIISKLTSILLDRFQKQIEELAKLDWNDAQAKITTPSKYTNQIIQNTRSLYVAIEDILMQEDLRIVFTMIMQLLCSDFVKIFNNFTIINKIGFTRVKEELEYFLSNVKEIGDLSILLKDKYEQLENDIQQVIEIKSQEYQQIQQIQQQQS